MLEITNDRLPQECLLDRNKLARIDTNVDDLAREFRAFISSEGPFVNVRERVRVLESTTFDNKAEILKVRGESSSLVVKVAALTALISNGLLLVVFQVFGGN